MIIPGVGVPAGDRALVTGRPRLSPPIAAVTIMQLQAHAMQVRETSFADEIPSEISFRVLSL